MMKAMHLLALVAATLLARPDRAAAQDPMRHRFWLEFATGPASAHSSCGGCDDVTINSGWSGLIRFGFKLSDNIALGLEAFGFVDESFGFAKADTSVVAQTESAGIVVLWYPWRNGLLLKAGMGAAHGRFTVAPEGQNPVLAEGRGIGLNAGFGYDIPLSRRFAFSINANAVVTAIGDILLPTEIIDDVIASMYQLTIGVTLR